PAADVPGPGAGERAVPGSCEPRVDARTARWRLTCSLGPGAAGRSSNAQRCTARQRNAAAAPESRGSKRRHARPGRARSDCERQFPGPATALGYLGAAADAVVGDREGESPDAAAVVGDARAAGDPLRGDRDGELPGAEAAVGDALPRRAAA